MHDLNIFILFGKWIIVNQTIGFEETVSVCDVLLQTCKKVVTI